MTTTTLRRMANQRLSRAASARVAPIVARICEIEGMLAHKATADLRERRYGSGVSRAVTKYPGKLPDTA